MSVSEAKIHFKKQNKHTIFFFLSFSCSPPKPFGSVVAPTGTRRTRVRISEERPRRKSAPPRTVRRGSASPRREATVAVLPRGGSCGVVARPPRAQPTVDGHVRRQRQSRGGHNAQADAGARGSTQKVSGVRVALFRAAAAEAAAAAGARVRLCTIINRRRQTTLRPCRVVVVVASNPAAHVFPRRRSRRARRARRFGRGGGG